MTLQSECLLCGVSDRTVSPDSSLEVLTLPQHPRVGMDLEMGPFKKRVTGHMRSLEPGLVQSDCVLRRGPVCGQAQDNRVGTQGDGSHLQGLEEQPWEGRPLTLTSILQNGRQCISGV